MAALFGGVVRSVIEDDAVLGVEPVIKVKPPETGRPFPSRGFYFGLLALALVGLWALGGTFSPLTIVLSLLTVYAAGVLRILRGHSKILDNLSANQDHVYLNGAFKRSTKIIRYSALFILPSIILIVLAAAIVLFLVMNTSQD